MKRFGFGLLAFLTVVALIILVQVERGVAESGNAISPGSATAAGSSICGIKFNDLNNNGIRESTEPGLSAFVFELLDAGGNVVGLSTLSALNPLGQFCFNGAPAGTYTVREKPKAGWNQTYPSAPGTYSVTIGNGTANPNLLFGNTQASPITSACGIKFNDLNNNGIRESTEPGLAGFVFELLDAGGNVVGLSTLSALNPLGEFCFNGVPAGTYTVREKPKQGWNQTYPANPGTYSVSFGYGVANPNLLFGNTQASPITTVCGIKFNDVNNNGVQDAGEPGLPSFVFELLDAGGNVVGLSTLSALSPPGKFCFNGMVAGTYTVREKPKQGWNQTYPAAQDTYSVTFGYGADNPTLLFGNTQAAPITTACGSKFNDANNNGVQESTEPGLSGFGFELLDAGGNVVGTASSGLLTAASPIGSFCFDGVAAGSYTVREVPKPGWNLSYPPAPGTYSVTFGYGVANPNLLFGNTQAAPITSACGIKFNDVNNNGTKEWSEPGLSGFVFELLDTGGNVVALSTLSSISPLGNFCFNGMTAGTYTVREKPKPGWNLSYPPAPGTYSVTFGYGATNPYLYFGNTQAPPITSACGIKFNDLNNNGIQESNEPGLSGFVFELLDTGGNVVALSTLSSISPLGKFCFNGMTAGTYTVREKPKSGWNLSYPPAPGTYSLTFGYGANNPNLLFGNTQAPPITSACGVKFNDLNGNGVQETGEPGLSGFVFELLDAGENVVGLSTLSAFNPLGKFCFNNVPVGSYTVREKAKPGWNLTYPSAPGTYSVTFGYGAANPNLLFGNTKVVGSSSVCGTKFNDVNGNGVQEPTEPGLSDFGFELLDAGGNVVGTALSGAPLGSFCFDNVQDGWYRVREVPKLGWEQTYPVASAMWSFTLDAVAFPSPNLLFGNTQVPADSSVCGIKFADQNGNGVQDTGELGLGGWSIQITDVTGNVVATVVTDENGKYCITHLSPGTYTIAEVMQSDWEQTYPKEPGTHTITVDGSQSVEGLAFGNRQSAATICGIKFADQNGNGMQDAGELGLGGWSIQAVNDDGRLVATVVTRDDGRFCFRSLRPGIYTFSEVMQDGWVQTFPDKPGTHTVWVAGGQNRESIDFGNQKKPDPCCLSLSFQQGRADNFATADGAEPAQPSTALRLSDDANLNAISRFEAAGFDGTLLDRFVLHTFTLPPDNCVESATLEFRAKPLGNASDDTLSLKFAGVSGNPGWGSYLGPFQSGSGLVTSPWNLSNYSTGQLFSLDLASLPGGVNLISLLSAHRFLDFRVRDDTSVDYVRLNVEFCECGNSGPRPVEVDPNPPQDKTMTSYEPDVPGAGTPEVVKADPSASGAGTPTGVSIRLVLDSREAVVNGKASRLSKPAVVHDGSTLLPFRDFGNLLGAAVEWDMADRRATYLLGDSKVEVWIGQRMARVNGKEFALSIEPVLIDGSTYVPLRSIVEAFELTVEYDPSDRSIRIFDGWNSGTGR